MALIFVAGVVGCKPDYVEPDQVNPTEGGYGDTGGGIHPSHPRLLAVWIGMSISGR